MHCRSALKADADVLYGTVKIERRLIAERVMLIEAERTDQPLRQVYHSSVADNHSFGHSRRAACEYAVDRVQVYHLRTYMVQSVLLLLKRGNISIFQAETSEVNFVKHRIICISDSHCCDWLQHFRDESHTLVRHPAVYWDIEIPAFNRAHETRKTLNPPVYKDKHRLAQGASGSF